MNFKEQFSTWWLARDERLRKFIKGTLTVLAVICAVAFFSFTWKTNHHSTVEKKISRDSVEIGMPQPWFLWEKTSEQTQTRDDKPGHFSSSASFSMNSRSHVEFMTWSFAAGIALVLILALRRWVVRCEKSPADSAAS